jgi:endonuclease III
MSRFRQLIALLGREYGDVKAPPAKGPFELILWENACYLLPDERRLAVFERLRQKVGLNAAAIQDAPDEVLLPLAKMGGMRPETRVFRWRQIAQITVGQFEGNLDSILEKPYLEARKALNQFPSIGIPGAEKILLFCGISSGLPLESNGLRVLERVGWGRPQKSYEATYRSVQDALRPELPKSAGTLARAHLLLREHGKVLCKTNAPSCHECPAEKICQYAARQANL